MCPGIAVLGGGGEGGDADGDGSGGKDGAGGDGKGNGKNGANDGKSADGAPDYAKYPECGYASHPVDVVTGRAFTHPIVDLELPPSSSPPRPQSPDECRARAGFCDHGVGPFS